MPINANYEFASAESKFLNAKTSEEKVIFLEEMIRTAPKHKGSENLLAELKRRLKKLKEKQEIDKKSKKGSQRGIRKEGFQVLIIGSPNTGKSSMLKVLTNASPMIADYPFTTKYPEIGTMDYEGVKAQLIDLPAFGSEHLDTSIIYTADFLLILISSLTEMYSLPEFLKNIKTPRLYLLNKSDLLSEQERRKIEATSRSKKLPIILTSTFTSENVQLIKRRIFEQMKVIRIYLKEPSKPASQIPLVLPEHSTVKDAAESILKGLSLRIKESIITGPSSKFPNQQVGLSHVLKDRDILEFHTH